MKYHDPNIQSINNYWQNNHFNTHDDFLSENLYDELFISEMDVVVGNLENNKSPGWDGLTAEFSQRVLGNFTSNPV